LYINQAFYNSTKRSALYLKDEDEKVYYRIPVNLDRLPLPL